MLNLQKYPQRIRKTQETSGFHQFDTLKGLVSNHKPAAALLSLSGEMVGWDGRRRDH
jgi:hypothetical protein